MIDPRDILIISYLAFLIPLAVYCFILGLVNSRTKPVMVGGVWDSIGLMLGISGLLLFSGPLIIFYRFLPRQVSLWPFWLATWVLWAGYWGIVLGGAGLLIWLRRHKTVIYNVDPALFNQVLYRRLAKLRLHSTRLGRKLWLRQWTPEDEKAGEPVMTEIQTGPAPDPIGERNRMPSPWQGEGERRGQLDVEPFPAMSNVTLHWRDGPPRLRVEIEDELRGNLDECRALDNPSAGWFMGLGSLFFGFVVLSIILIIVLRIG